MEYHAREKRRPHERNNRSLSSEMAPRSALKAPDWLSIPLITMMPEEAHPRGIRTSKASQGEKGSRYRAQATVEERAASK